MESDSDRKKVQLCEELYLLYFNRTLLEKGLISEVEYRLMDAQIRSRSSHKKSANKSVIKDREFS